MEDPNSDPIVVAPPPVVEDSKDPPPLPPRPKEGDLETEIKRGPDVPVAKEEPSPKRGPRASLVEEEVQAKNIGETGGLSERISPLRKRRRTSVVDALAKNIGGDLEVVSIEVCEPIQKADRLMKWTEYKIKVEYDTGDTNQVQRRYKHFNWLRNQLALEHRGIIIPPLPEKNFLNRFDELFIEKRRARLQQFLMRILRKKELKDDNAFILFLKGTGEQFAKVFKGPSQSSSERASGMYNSYRLKKESLKQSYSSNSKPLGPDEMKCASLRELGTHLGSITASLGKGLSSMDERQNQMYILFEEISNHLSQINPNVVTIAKSSTDVDVEPLSFLVGRFQDLMGQLSQVKEHTDRAYLSEMDTPDGPSQIFLRDIFDDFSRYGKAIVQCLDGRKQCYLQTEAERSTLQSRQESLASLKNSTSSYTFRKESRIEKTTALIETSIEVVQAWEDELDRVTKVAYSEVENYTGTLAPILRSGLCTFADLEIERLEKQLALWRDFRTDL